MSSSDEKSKIRRKRKKRTIISPEQLIFLERTFKKDAWPDRCRKCKIARELGTSDNFVTVWFQNRRARERRCSTQRKKENINLIKIEIESRNKSPEGEKDSETDKIHCEESMEQSNKNKVEFEFEKFKSIKNKAKVTVMLRSNSKAMKNQVITQKLTGISQTKTEKGDSTQMETSNTSGNEGSSAKAFNKFNYTLKSGIVGKPLSNPVKKPYTAPLVESAPYTGDDLIPSSLDESDSECAEGSNVRFVEKYIHRETKFPGGDACFSHK